MRKKSDRDIGINSILSYSMAEWPSNVDDVIPTVWNNIEIRYWKK